MTSTLRMTITMSVTCPDSTPTVCRQVKRDSSRLTFPISSTSLSRSFSKKEGSAGDGSNATDGLARDMIVGVGFWYVMLVACCLML